MITENGGLHDDPIAARGPLPQLYGSTAGAPSSAQWMGAGGPIAAGRPLLQL